MKDTSFDAYIADQAMVGKVKREIRKEERNRLINKACEWLSNNKDKYILDIEGETIVDEKIVVDFKKTMEE